MGTPEHWLPFLSRCGLVVNASLMDFMWGPKASSSKHWPFVAYSFLEPSPVCTKIRGFSEKKPFNGTFLLHLAAPKMQAREGKKTELLLRVIAHLFHVCIVILFWLFATCSG